MKTLLTLLTAVVVMLAVLLQLEYDEDLLLAEKRAAMPKARSKLFQYVSDLRNHAEWMPDVTSFEPTDSMPMGIGKHFMEIKDIPLIGEVHYDNLVTAYESPRHISYLSNDWLLLRWEIEFERRPNSPEYPSQITVRLFSRRKSFFTQYLLNPILKHKLGQKVRTSLFNLKFVIQK